MRRTPRGTPIADAGERAEPLRVYRPSLLVVSASHALRMRCEQVFQAAGYHIFTTDLGRSAIAFLRETSDPPDLVVCDTDAADVRALDVAEAAYRRDTKVIPISSDRFAEQGRDGFEFDTLVARVESMLPSSYLERPRSA